MNKPSGALKPPIPTQSSSECFVQTAVWRRSRNCCNGSHSASPSWDLSTAPSAGRTDERSNTSPAPWVVSSCSFRCYARYWNWIELLLRVLEAFYQLIPLQYQHTTFIGQQVPHGQRGLRRGCPDRPRNVADHELGSHTKVLEFQYFLQYIKSRDGEVPQISTSTQ